MVEKLHGSIAYEHKVRFLAPPTEHASIKLLMKSIRRNFSKPSVSVDALTTRHLTTINSHLEKQSSENDLQILRTVWRLNIEFYSLCRFSEINILTTKDVQVIDGENPMIVLNIRKSKTDQLRKGNTKHLYSVKNHPLLCPVRLTQKYLARLAKHLPGNQQYEGNLQPRVQNSAKLKFQIPLANTIVSYTSCLEETKKLLCDVGITGHFGEHSGRRGGASSAAANGASMDEIQKLGNWKSAKSACRYIDSDPSEKESLSRKVHPK